MTELTAKEISVIKTAASDYAKRFLSRKYYEEYAELYQAYCTNRGVSTRNMSTLVDERLLVKADN